MAPKSDRSNPVAGRSRGVARGEFVLGRLRRAIRGGRYLPGQRIREAEAAAWLGVSRTPVREAFRRLQADGLLVLTPWRGAAVVELGRDQVIELYAMRRVLEGAAAGLAAGHASDAETQVIHDLLKLDETAGADPERLAENNRLFHQAIYAAAHNRYLLQALNALADSLALLGPTTYEVPGRAGRARLEHVEIADAIKIGDAEAAERTARAHIAAAEKARIELLFGDGCGDAQDSAIFDPIIKNV